MISTPTGLRRAPDFQTVKDGRTEYWEVKFRARSDVDLATGGREHWMPRASYVDYLDVARTSRSEVWVVLYEAPTSLSPGRWLRASVRRLRDAGHVGTKTDRSGEPTDAWVWPIGAMEVIEGPPVQFSAAGIPVLSTEGQGRPLQTDELMLAERARRSRRHLGSDIEPQAPSSAAAESALDRDAEVGRDVICERLGLAARPRYSVLRVGPLADTVDDVLELLHYGIRVFLVTDRPVATALEDRILDAFEAARLLERAVVPSLPDEVHWVLDGAMPDPIPPSLATALDQADATGKINVGQYKIVHAGAGSSILVTAGAGTGKTETMAERLIFLLATDDVTEEVDGEIRPGPLRADEVALVTFTREAAKEMRARLARTLMLRQRLCALCIYPARAWLMQLSNARITTIHSFASQFVKRAGGSIGFGPGIRVSAQTMEFRALLQRTLSPHLSRIMTSHLGAEVPPAHAWQAHLETVWETLENKGTSLMSFSNGEALPEILDWGDEGDGALDREIFDATRTVLVDIAEPYAELCRADQAVPASQLVPLAISAINAHNPPIAAGPRHLFVDEFQDTDAQQMELLLDVYEHLGATLFLVGDAKQGIYGFRGAEGNAFGKLAARAAARHLHPIPLFFLTRNFRSGRRLLDSLHPMFRVWGEVGLLTYGTRDRLRPRVDIPDFSRAISTRRVPYGQDPGEYAAALVGGWRSASAGDSIAILCRTNRQAENVQAHIRRLGGTCELLVGGSFFLSPAVREVRVLLEALASPHEDAALLELCETRWSVGIMDGPPPPALRAEMARVWAEAEIALSSWRTRLAHLAVDGNFEVVDLLPLRARVVALRELLSETSVIGLLVDCMTWFRPEGTAIPNDDDTGEERGRYLRCLDHLVTLMDSHFGEGAASLDSVLSWVKLQIATNRNEDEPFDIAAATAPGRTLALTVHKAKGLEFDRVVIPDTATRFDRGLWGRTAATVLRPTGSSPRLMWEWRESRTGPRFGNFADGDDLANLDRMESLREEARLLYVATTRARAELVVQVPPNYPRVRQVPDSWADLLAMGWVS
jgi:DNA helicase-2/ATP-dependent DNA helicase PcrA